MGIFSRNTLKDWFGFKKKPTAEQFENLIDSFFHKAEDTLEIGKVTGLSDALNAKAAQLGLDIANQAIGVITNLQTQNKSNLVSAINEVLINAGNSEEATTYNRSSPATRQLGGVNVGDEIEGLPLDELLEKMLAPYTAPTLSNTALTGQSAYNAQNVNKAVTFRWVKNVGTPDFVSAQIQYRRTGETEWTDLATTVNHVNATTEDASASITVNTAGANNAGVEFRCIWIDASTTQTAATVTSSFAGYQAPSKTNPSVGNTTRERGDKNATASSTITRNSLNVAHGTYQWQVSINGGSWTDISGATGTLTTDSQTVSVTHNDATVLNADNVAYRVAVTDVQGTTYSNSTTITFVNRRVLGYSTNANPDLTTILGMANSELNSGKARTVTGVTAGSGEYAFIAYAASAGDLSGIVQNDATPVLGAFTKLSDLTGTNSFGATVTMRVYRSNATNAFTGDKLAIT